MAMATGSKMTSSVVVDVVVVVVVGVVIVVVVVAAAAAAAVRELCPTTNRILGSLHVSAHSLVVAPSTSAVVIRKAP